MIRALERHPDYSYTLIDLYAGADTEPRDPDSLQATLLPHVGSRAQVDGTFADFRKRFHDSTGGLADRFRSVPGVVFAGGSVIASVVDSGYSDIDIFLVCGLASAREILEGVYTALAEMVTERFGSRKGRLLVTRSKHAITTVSREELVATVTVSECERVRGGGGSTSLSLQVLPSRGGSISGGADSSHPLDLLFGAGVADQLRHRCRMLLLCAERTEGMDDAAWSTFCAVPWAFR